MAPFFDEDHRSIRQMIIQLQGQITSLQKLLEEHLRQQQVAQPQQQPSYGPHEFGRVEFMGDAVFARCDCGASEGAVGGCGASLSPAPNPLPDPKQCRLNPLL